MATVDRVLPWRKTAAAESMVTPVVDAYRLRHAKGDASMILRAFDSAAEAHRDQMRASGESYIHHPVAVASIVAGLGLDDITIAAALLHDAVEDTSLTLDDVNDRFGPVVASVVDGVTKLDRVAFDSKEAQQAATMRKMLVAMAKDWRVLIIKLADRLHNMRTVAAMPIWKQHRSAQETLDIYAPLAHRLGIQELRWQLEDLSFAVLHPKLYAEIDHMVAVRAPEREAYLSGVLDTAREHLGRLGVDALVTGRPKNLYSIYEKMVVKGKEFNEIYDLIGIRVLVESQKDCYAAIGAIHATWPPLPGRVKDYIATPKFNLYQSLHTTVVGPQGKPLEVQIRTHDMHRRAEFGIAAHWGYKEKATPRDIAWVQRFVDWQQDTTDPAEFLETLKLDLDTDEVYVFTPKGDIMTLPVGSVPVDFAYAIHTEVGHRCIGARVNGRLARLDSKLTSGDTVEVITSKLPTAGPSRDWLEQVASPRARNKIRQWFSRERRDDAIDNGRDELFKAMRREGLPVQKLSNSPMLPTIAVEIGHADLDGLYAAIGENHVSAHSVAQRIARELRGGDHEEQLPTTARQERRSARKQHPAGVYVEGLDDVMVRLSKCCTPVPGDAILGFVTRGRGVSVHRVDCANAASLTAMADSGESRLIEVEWDRESPGVFMVSIEVLALDRTRLLLDVSRVLSEHHINILGSSTGAGADRLSRMRFDIELADPTHLETLLAAIKRVDSVYDAYRALPGRN
ncbi:MAG TPA: bifunctional (p)ppGpp synthetase/guanosine-3',5'-bis(diphosphate) 3'-pyrophosphohydrolase [Acidimicrobiales bacterium]|nr:bifunctional (p)ppGpp synthetase/guanosine-3',5'-bis(diphosphate) 3'-pyrophosphohydrolase [Acidimicrobiales bacterium]